MDLTSVALLSMFGSAIAGGLIGFAVGRMTRFEIGLATGLMIFGGVALWFAGQCFLEYRAFTSAGSNGVWGEAVRIEEIPIGNSGAQTAPVVRFSAPDGTVHTVLGPRASSAKVGEHLIVIYDPTDPQRSRVGQIGELRGCAIALLLFATFPLSFSLFMLYSTFVGEGASGLKTARSSPDNRHMPDRPDQQASSKATKAPIRSTLFTAVTTALHLTMFGAIVWIGLGTGDLGQRFSQGFGAVAAALAGYAILGLVGRNASPVWSFGVFMLAINFAVWAWALHLLI